MDIAARFDEGQRAGVSAGGGLVVIQAGAGTGKTTVVTHRIRRLLREGVPGAAISAVTFTKKAAREMAERTTALCGAEIDASTVRFQTLHSLAAGILRRHWADAGFAAPEFVIGDADELAETMREALDRAGVMEPLVAGEEKEHAAYRRDWIKLATRRIARWKENGLGMDEVLDSDRAQRSEADEACARVYVEYQRALSSRNMVDFADLCMRANDTMRRSERVRLAESSRIRQLMVDEFQDTNTVQLGMVELLTRDADVTVVGDPDQSIYSFRSVVPGLMDEAPRRLPRVAARGTTLAALVECRRCTRPILQPATIWMDLNTRADPKVLNSTRDGPPVTVSGHLSEVSEGKDVAGRIASLVAKGVPPSEIAVLCRTGDPLKDMSRLLAERRVPHRVESGISFMERTEVMDVMAYLKLAMDPRQDLAFSRIAARPVRGLGAKAVESVIEIAASRGFSIHDALSALAESGTLVDKAERSASLMARHLGSIAHAARSGESSESIVRYVLDTVGYRAWAMTQKKSPPTLATSIETLLDMARAQPDFIEFVTDTSLDADPDSSGEDGRGGVCICTIHGSKGREWRHVFVVAFEDGIIPSRMSMEEASLAADGDPDDPWTCEGGGGIEEERRLAHVALTRAKDSVHISFALRRMAWGKHMPASPSRFIREAELVVPRVPRPAAKAAKWASRPVARPVASPKGRHTVPMDDEHPASDEYWD